MQPIVLIYNWGGDRWSATSYRRNSNLDFSILQPLKDLRLTVNSKIP